MFHCEGDAMDLFGNYYPVSPKIADVLVRQPSFWHSQPTQAYAKLDLTRYYWLRLEYNDCTEVFPILLSERP